MPHALLGHGIDIVSIATIRQLLAAPDSELCAGWLSERELAASPSVDILPRWLSGRIAAKEAVVKALGTGFTDDVAFQDVEILTDNLGAPVVVLSEGAALAASRRAVTTVLVSISHTHDLTIASAVALGA